MTLMSAEEAGALRRCDAACYNAETSRCSCVCRGMNHGRGLAAAKSATRDHAPELAARGVSVSEEALQGDLCLGDLTDREEV